MIFSENELLLMIGVVSVLLLCISILTILDIKDYLKSKKGIVIEEEEIKEKSEPIEVTLMDNEPEFVENGKQEELFLEEVADMEEIKPEINPIIEDGEEVFIPKEEVKEATIEVQEETVKKDKKILDAFEELEEIENNLPNEKDDITNFEAEQERTAIISLDELLKKSNELYNDNEVVQYDDGDEPISIDEVIKMFKKEETSQNIETKEVPKEYQDVVSEHVPYSRKETIPFISSVYGIEKENNTLEFENTATYEKLDRDKYNDFVAQLKEMNENK